MSISAEIKFEIPSIFSWLFRGKEQMEKNELIRRIFFVYLTSGMALGALIWGSISLFYGLQSAALVPFGYVLFTVLNLYLCRNANNHSVYCKSQVLLSISLPFVFQFMLGGIASSGCVMLWSILALLGTVSFLTNRETLYWFFYAIALVICSCWIETAYFSSEGAPSLSPILLGLNSIFLCTILFFLSRQFLDMQIELRKQIILGSKDIEAKNKEIGRSIDAARNIQQNILPTHNAMKKAFPKHFIYNRPLNVVSGDFHWLGTYAGKRILACVDCTGHGVPGAFMSMMGYNLLNQIVYKELVMDPAEILRQLDHAVRHSLKQESSGSSEGMDMSIISYDPSSGVLEFAGARGNIILEEEEGWTLLKGTKRSIGGSLTIDCDDFVTENRIVNPGSKLIMMTDGIVDQFGGPKNKRVRTSPFIEWLKEPDSKGIKKLGAVIEENLIQWQGDEDQVDDMLLIGLEF